jgi:methylenetetrahydrofolate reductase (NADPH)
MKLSRMSRTGMIHVPRFEIMPFRGVHSDIAALTERVRLTVTCSPTYGLDHTVAMATGLRELGHEVTAHLAARMVRDRGHLNRVLAALAAAGVDDVFLIGGDSSSPIGPYTSALQLLPIIDQHSHRPSTIGIAGYPEGHPLMDSDVLKDVLVAKSERADYVVTQLCFSPEAVLAWLREIRRIGVGLPVLVGLPGVVDRRKLLEISIRVGVGPSLSFLRKQGVGRLMRLSAATVDQLHRALLPHIGCDRLGLTGFHYFTFNRVLDTWRWAQSRSQSPGQFADKRERAPR